MKNKKCPTRKRCFDYGNCDGCDLGDNITKLHKRIDRLKKQNETLTIQRNAWALTAKAMANKWISVDERLPKEVEHLIVCDEDGTVGEAIFLKASGRFEWVDNEEIAFATHWMPLPEPPMMKGGAE